MEQRVAHNVPDAEDADQDNSRPENQAQESPSKLFLIVHRLRGEKSGIWALGGWLCIVYVHEGDSAD
jgi:hypothetical protein